MAGLGLSLPALATRTEALLATRSLFRRALCTSHRLAAPSAAAAESSLAAGARLVRTRAAVLEAPLRAPLGRRATHSGPPTGPTAAATAGDPVKPPQPPPKPQPSEQLDEAGDPVLPWPPKKPTPEDDDRPVFDAVLPWPVSAALAVAFAALSAYIASEAIGPVQEASATRAWPSCSGVVVRSGSEEGASDPFTLLFAERDAGGNPFLRNPVVEYAYSPDWEFDAPRPGVKPSPQLAAARAAAASGSAPFSSSVLYRDGALSHFVSRPQGPRRLRQFLDKYAPGTPVRVHYDPQDPSRATLFPGTSGESIARAVPVLPFVILASFVFGRGALRRFGMDAVKRAAGQ
eukprot:tig00020571_g11490.t1